MFQNMPACRIWPIVWSVNNFNEKKILESSRRQSKEILGPNLKAIAYAIRELRGIEYCEDEHIDTTNFMYSFVQKTYATKAKQLFWRFIRTCTEVFFFPMFSL